MKIVVTGALGHIGSRLIRELPTTSPVTDILLMDNLSTQRYCSLFNLPARCRYHFLEEDILTADLASIFQGANVVVHLAAITDATTSFQNKEEVHRVNFLGTQRVAEACHHVGCPLIFPSTTSVYGSQSREVDEACVLSELKPQSPYAEAKLKSENLLLQMNKDYGLRFIACRFGTIFGSSIGMRFHTAVNKFCWQAVLGQPLTVWETALHQHRPYLDLSDAVEAIRFIIEKQLYDGAVYNIVTTNAALIEVIGAISEYIPGTALRKVSTPIMNQLSYHVSNRRFCERGFTFRGNLTEGIGETIELLKGLRQQIDTQDIRAAECR